MFVRAVFGGSRRRLAGRGFQAVPREGLALYMAYLAVFRPAGWKEARFLQSWWERLAGSPVEWLLAAAALALLVHYRRALPAAWPELQLVAAIAFGACFDPPQAGDGRRAARGGVPGAPVEFGAAFHTRSGIRATMPGP
jgi:hypothetical protein